MTQADSGLWLGEIHTGLLQNSGALTSEAAADLLALVPQHAVRIWERPIRHAASPEILTGVDCTLPSAAGSRVRGVGTVATEVRMTGGQLLQSSTRVQVLPATERRRLPWSHYLTRPAVVESQGEARRQDLVGGFLSQDPKRGTLDLGGVCAHVMGSVQASTAIDHLPPFRAGRTKLRWAAAPLSGGDAATIAFALESPSMRTVRIEAPAHLAGHVPELCQDLALHDWLLSSIVALIDVAHIGQRERTEVLRQLRPAVDHLLHAWMPAARLPDDLSGFWDEVEKRSGLTRQWESAVRRIRDQVSLATVELAGMGVGIAGSRKMQPT